MRERERVFPKLTTLLERIHVCDSTYMARPQMITHGPTQLEPVDRRFDRRWLRRSRIDL